MNFNFLNALFGTNSRPDIGQRQEATTAHIESSPSDFIQLKSATAKRKYDADVEALEAMFGTLTDTELCIRLADLLQICPRKRPRIEAYQGLVSHLKAEYGATLTIKSRKTR